MSTLPEAFVNMALDSLADLTEPRLMVEALATSSPQVSVRVNPRKPVNLPWTTDGPVAWCPNGHYLPERPLFTLAPELHQGRIYVQDASSMFIHSVIAQLTSPDNPVTYLDACAAPGGKTTAAIDTLPDQSLVVANEYDPRRAAVLRENLTKWGYPHLVVSQGDTAQFSPLEGMFNIVAADVPCSGEGMFRKDPEAVRQWTPALVNECVARQKSIISNLWPAVAPGGYLIYSTCTFNKHENEELIQWITENFSALPVEISIPDGSGILRSATPSGAPCYRFMPHALRGEGLFMAVLQKSPDDSASPASQRKKSRDKGRGSDKPAPQLDKCRNWISDPDQFTLSLNNSLVTAFPKSYAQTLRTLQNHLRIIQTGVAVATVKGSDLIPEHPLAMSTIFRHDAFPHLEVPLPIAIDYLRREAITLPPDTPRGFVTLTYRDLPLGFVKNIGNRSNNLYPQAWRVLMEPDKSGS